MVTHGTTTDLNETDVQLETQDEFALLRKGITDLARKAYEKNARLYNLRSRTKEFTIGQEVIRRNSVQSSKISNFIAKLAPIAVKVRVLRKIEEVNYELEDPGRGMQRVYGLSSGLL